MEKLLNLLQEFYWENRKFSNDNWLLTMTNWVENLSGAYAQTYIISLKGGFIKWLVENDKINTDPIRTRVKRVYIELEPREFTPQDFVDRVIMLLATSDTPIEDLVSYLK